jgi:hypothetical protein
MSASDANYRAAFAHDKAWYSILYDEYGVPLGTVTNPIVVSGGGGAGLGVEGLVDDDAAVGATKPVVIGGVYYADPPANPLENGDAGYALLNNERMQVVEDHAYDPVSDANKNIPVWSVPDGWTSEDLSSSLGANGTVVKYVTGLPHKTFSLQFIPVAAVAETIAVTIAVSNEVTGDVMTQTYTDVTSDLTGSVSIAVEKVIDPELPVRAITWRFTFTVTGWSAGTSAWDAFLVKGND